MKKIIILTVLSFLAVQIQAQTEPASIEVGDILTINEPEQQNFTALNLPRANFIIKKGGIANYKSLVGNHVKVVEVSTNKNGETEILLKRTDGRKFFKSFPSISANLDAALETGELSL